jgi:hypothetical protein
MPSQRCRRHRAGHVRTMTSTGCRAASISAVPAGSQRRANLLRCRWSGDNPPSQDDRCRKRPHFRAGRAPAGRNRPLSSEPCGPAPCHARRSRRCHSSPVAVHAGCVRHGAARRSWQAARVRPRQRDRGGRTAVRASSEPARRRRAHPNARLSSLRCESPPGRAGTDP